MRTDLEQMYLALLFGKRHLHMMAAAAETLAAADLKRAEKLIYDATLLIEKHIDPADISILQKELP